MAQDNHGSCPSCGVSFDGGSIWQTGLDFAYDGKHYSQKGEPAYGEEAEQLADDYARAYGADRHSGRWGRQIGIYSTEKDRTVAWRCPDCGHEWSRV
jgi:predicted RNA-binding Zn-ribbon protein involved in translation (DUF1610 family)